MNCRASTARLNNTTSPPIVRRVIPLRQLAVLERALTNCMSPHCLIMHIVPSRMLHFGTLQPGVRSTKFCKMIWFFYIVYRKSVMYYRKVVDVCVYGAVLLERYAHVLCGMMWMWMMVVSPSENQRRQCTNGMM